MEPCDSLSLINIKAKQVICYYSFKAQPSLMTKQCYSLLDFATRLCERILLNPSH